MNDDVMLECHGDLNKGSFVNERAEAIITRHFPKGSATVIIPEEVENTIERKFTPSQLFWYGFFSVAEDYGRSEYYGLNYLILDDDLPITHSVLSLYDEEEWKGNLWYSDIFHNLNENKRNMFMKFLSSFKPNVIIFDKIHFTNDKYDTRKIKKNIQSLMEYMYIYSLLHNASVIFIMDSDDDENDEEGLKNLLDFVEPIEEAFGRSTILRYGYPEIDYKLPLAS